MKVFKKSRTQIINIAIISLAINIVYALGNFALGIWGKSYWFLTIGAYNLILAVMRFSVVLCNRRSKEKASGSFVSNFVGIMLVLLGFVLSGSVYLSVKFDVSKSFHEIIMIAIATYTFTKITIAVINYVKKNKFNSHIITSLRGIALCDAAASVYSLQKSMLVSFDGMEQQDIQLMNILTGVAVCVFVVVLGLIMLKKEKKNG